MQSAPLSVAIVDDDPSVRRGLSRLVRSFGSSAQAFVSGEEFLEQLDTVAPDIVLLDYQLSGATGIEIFELALARRPDLQIHIISASDSPTLGDECRAAGSAGFIAKPVTAEDLAAIIGSHTNDPHNRGEVDEEPHA